MRKLHLVTMITSGKNTDLGEKDQVSEKSKINKETSSDDSKKKELWKKDGSTKKQEADDKETNKKIASPQSEDKK